MAPRHEKFLQRVGEIFFNDPNIIRSSIRKSNKKILPCRGGWKSTPRVGGGTTLLEFALVSENAIKNAKYWGGGGFPPPPPAKYYAPELALTLLLNFILVIEISI